VIRQNKKDLISKKMSPSKKRPWPDSFPDDLC
jgi:hypothetical protein